MPMPNFKEMRAVGAVLMHVDEGMDMTKVKGYFVTLRMRLRAVKIFNRQNRNTNSLPLTY
jgi:hypothetical protein